MTGYFCTFCLVFTPSMEKQDVGGWALEEVFIYFYFTFLKCLAPSNNKCKFKAFFFCKDVFVLKPNLAKLFKDLF